jgi:hypothetical protein
MLNFNFLIVNTVLVLRLLYKVLNRRAEKLSLVLEIIGIALIFFGIILFFYFMDLYSDPYSKILNGININSQSSYTKEKAWDTIFLINYPSVILSLSVALGLSLFIMGGVLASIFSKKHS